MEDKKLDEILSLLRVMQKGKLTSEELILVRQIIKEKQEEAELRKVIKTKLLSKGALVMMGGLVSALAYALHHYLKAYF